jgi:hypothetical protein
MASLRLIPVENAPPVQPCCRCRTAGHNWDRIMGKSYCPDCEEALATGEGEPLIERAERNACAVCGLVGTVRYLTFPLESAEVLEIDLCARHFRELLGRRLGVFAFQQLRRQLQAVNLDAGQVFLLHDAFYDADGQALQPAVELE